MSESSLQSLQEFFQSSPVARLATRSLDRSAEVALQLEGGVVGRFSMESGEARVLQEPARNPDFTLVLPDQAVARMTTLSGDDVGEFGVEFFKLMLSKDPGLRVRARINASTMRILGGGYLRVLASGGLKVTGWLLKNGVRNPKSAIDRMRGTGDR